MALEESPPGTNIYGIVNHISQILEDSDFIAWPNIRAFSNTVIANIARAVWDWNYEKAIVKSRNNQYMHSREADELAWSVPCPRYNRGRCEEDGTHKVFGTTMRHACSFCSALGFENPHTNRACNFKKRNNSASQGRQGGEEKKDNRGQKGSQYNRGDKLEDGAKN